MGMASLDESDIEFLIPADHDTYIDLNIQLYLRGKLTKADGTDLDDKDHTCMVNNLLYSLFKQGNISLNGVTITHAALNHYRAYLETILTYGRITASSHLTSASDIVIRVIWALARIHRLKRPVQTRGAARDAIDKLSQELEMVD